VLSLMNQRMAEIRHYSSRPSLVKGYSCCASTIALYVAMIGCKEAADREV